MGCKWKWGRRIFTVYFWWVMRLFDVYILYSNTYMLSSIVYSKNTSTGHVSLSRQSQPLKEEQPLFDRIAVTSSGARLLYLLRFGNE